MADRRQYGYRLSDIRRDHVARYEWAAEKAMGPVLDFGCGIGYGSWILAQSGRPVYAYDPESISPTYRDPWKHENIRWLADLSDAPVVGTIVAFEVLEHIEDPIPVLRSLVAPDAMQILLCSVPNEAALPFDPQRFPYHYRHYRLTEIIELLEAAGWRTWRTHGQQGKTSEVGPYAPDSRTIILECA